MAKVTEKASSFEEKIKGLELRFGKGSIIKASSDVFERVTDFSPTGSISLDSSIGVGGIPKNGKITHILGKESSSKCMDSGAYVLTDEGYKTVTEIFEENNVDLFIATKEIPKVANLINGNKEVEKTTHFTLNGRRKTWKIKTRTGFEFIRTYKHPILSISDSGNLIWKWAGELKPGDYIVKKHKEVFGLHSIPKNEAYIMGTWVADAGFYKNRILFTNDDPCIKACIPEMEKLVGVDVKEYKKSGKQYETQSKDYHFNSKKGTEFIYEKYDIKIGIAKDKVVPRKIRKCNKETLIEFLKGFFDCESCIDKQGIHTTSASFKLMYEIKMILTQFCINSFLTEKIVKGYEHNQYWRLDIYPGDCDKFIDKIGTNSEKVRNRYNNYKLERVDLNKNTNFYIIPNVKNIVKDIQMQDPIRQEEITSIISDLNKAELTYYKLEKLNALVEGESKLLDHLNLLSQYEFEEVTYCEYYDNIPTFDFAMERTHTFEADGFINHNTTLSLHIITEEQKKGGRCAFLDVEGTLDLTYAQNIGVDLDKLYLIDETILLKKKKPEELQAISGEEWLDICTALIETKEFDIIVLDSVAALCPKAELENGMSGASIAQLGRLMSKGLRQINAALLPTNTGLVLLNQYRINIGGYGNPYIETSGEALKYYTALKIELTKSLDKDTDGVYGILVKTKVTKNKVGRPYLEGSYYIEFGKGMDKLWEIVNLAVEFGIINKSGSWYSEGETKLGQGEESVKQFLLDNPDYAANIKQQVIDKLKNS